MAWATDRCAPCDEQLLRLRGLQPQSDMSRISNASADDAKLVLLSVCADTAESQMQMEQNVSSSPALLNPSTLRDNEACCSSLLRLRKDGKSAFTTTISAPAAKTLEMLTMKLATA